MIRYAMRTVWVPVLFVLALITGPAVSAATPVQPTLQFKLLIRTKVPLGEILWTGSSFIYDGEGRRTLYTSNPDGSNFRIFTTVPKNGGEMRCVLSPAQYGFARNVLFCHASGGQIYQLSMDGKTITLLGAIPTPHGSDGGLTFDTTGIYGHVLLASTGGSTDGPGSVYAIAASGKVRLVGNYSGPGGAERLSIAPQHFGSVSGEVLIPIDQSDHHGRLLAMDPEGRVRTLVTGLAWGLNPVAPITSGHSIGPGGAAPGLYVVDWESHNVLYTPASSLQQYAGSLFLGTERHGYMYVLQSTGNSYHLQPLRTNLTAPNYNMEGAVYIGG